MNIGSKNALLLIALLYTSPIAAATEDPVAFRNRLREAVEIARQGETRLATRIAKQSVREWQGRENEYVARYVLGVILQHQGDLNDAFLELQTVADHDDRLRDQATKRQVDICRLLMSPERDNGKSPGRRSRRRVVGMLESILMNDPLGVVAAAVHYHLGLYYEQAGRGALAKYYYESAADRAQVAEWYDRAFFGTARISYHEALASPRDMSLAAHAHHLLIRYLQDAFTEFYREVAMEMVDDIVAQIHESAFENARFYDHRRYPPRARIAAFQNFLRNYPHAPQADEAQQRMEQLQLQFAAELDRD